MNTPAPTLTFATLAPLAGPSGPFQLSPGGDPARQAIQSHLYYTQFYKGRTDGHPDDERMNKAIMMVQVAAHLPVTGIFNDDVREAIARFRRTQNFREKEPPPVTTTSPPVTAMPPPPRSLVLELATFAILTSPAWGLLLYLRRPWTKLYVGARGR